MKKWNAPEMVELSIAYTEKDNGTTAETNSGHNKTKTNQCECGHNTNFAFSINCTDCGFGYAGDDSVVTDTLS